MGRPVYNAYTGLFSTLGTPAPGWPTPVVNGALASTGSNALGTGRAGTGKVVAVVSGGNIDLSTFASLVLGPGAASLRTV